jgi:uncharacterized membrane protein YgcG
MKTRNKALSVALATLVTGTAIGTNGNAGLNFRARLLGSGEVPPVTDTAAQANATFRFSRDLTQMRVTLKLRGGEDITEAHLHCAPPGVNGPVVVPLIGLAGPAVVPLLDLIQGGFNGSLNLTATLTEASIVDYSSGGEDTANRGCSSVLGPGRDIVNMTQLVEAIRNGEIYVNVHSLAHPAGVIRGQVSRVQSSGGGGTGGGGSGTGGGGGGTGGGGTGGGSGY